ITHPMFSHPLRTKVKFGKADASKLKMRLKSAMKEVDRVIKSRRFDVVILDEILIGVSQGFVAEKMILKIIKSKPKETELILTGRGATWKLIDNADYVTYMKEIRHPFNKGATARKGVEF
ncbi:MAG: cob(I)yrinic acid a,c-diamide adenosyltransferase, partial [Candidatus Omnitrophica bacterium]|nr:cob(I)yrinic acid a,c-diamide adenosyltransferase [Candidatus Omnitrophota bacterium]